MNKKLKSGLTLLEILIIIGLVSLSISIFFPEISQFKEKLNQAICVNNLKQCHMAHMMYSADFNNYLVPNGNPPPPDYSRIWSTVLIQYCKYITDNKIIHCPSVEPMALSNSFCYGSWVRNEFIKMDELTEKYRKEPKDIILLADSWATNIQREMWLLGDDKQQIYTVPCRHNKSANILFLDGHVESMNAEEIKKGNFAPFTPSVLEPES